MATEPDIEPAVDRGEDIAAMQPMKIGEGGSRFRDAVDLALELTAKSGAFRSSQRRIARIRTASGVGASRSETARRRFLPRPNTTSARSTTTWEESRTAALEQFLTQADILWLA